jgi:NAD(P)H-hydrate epimerase
MSLPAEIYAVADVRKIDQAAINDAGISGYALMTRAAQAALDAARAEFPQAKRWQIVCGGGNNGGDGYVLARLAALQGIGVSVLTLANPESLGGDAATACVDFAAEGGVLANFEGTLDDEADLLVDALLGSGIERDVTGRYAEVVEAMNVHPAPVLALDIPSGLNADSGAVMGVAVRADLTVTFVGLKGGLLLDAGPEYTGRLLFAGLDIPEACYAGKFAVMRRIGSDLVRSALPPRKRNSHKGDFGHVLVVGGGPGMPGAVRLCGEAALRSGAGLVSIATHPAKDLAPLLERATVVALGPGLGTSDWSQALLDAVLQSGLPLVVDADALTLLAATDERRDDWILTPHPGEAARLLDTTSSEIQADRSGSLAKLRQKYGGTIILKGSGSLVSSHDGPDWLCSAGNPGMASPGMGDVLTGIAVAMRAQGLAPERAAVAAVEIHAQAGDAAAAAGQRGLLASDLLQELRVWVNG